MRAVADMLALVAPGRRAQQMRRHVAAAASCCSTSTRDKALNSCARAAHLCYTQPSLDRPALHGGVDPPSQARAQRESGTELKQQREAVAHPHGEGFCKEHSISASCAVWAHSLAHTPMSSGAACWAIALRSDGTSCPDFAVDFCFCSAVLGRLARGPRLLLARPRSRLDTRRRFLALRKEDAPRNSPRLSDTARQTVGRHVRKSDYGVFVRG